MTTAVLKRALGPVALIFYGVGDILGAGIYALVGKVAGVVGPAVWISFVVAFVAAVLTALSYAELSSRFPRSAGAAVYALEAFGSKLLSYVIGFMVVFSGVVSMAAASRAFAGYFTHLTPVLSDTAVIVIFFAVLAAINLKGIQESSGMNILCTLVEMSGLFIVIAAGLQFFGKADVLSVQPPPGDSPSMAILQGGAIAFYAFVGFEDIVNVAEESKDSSKTIPRAILTSLGAGTFIYILVALAAVSTVAPAELAASSAPLAHVVQKGFPDFPIRAFSVIALFAVANTALLNYVMSSRVLYGMSSDGLIPAFLKNVHSKTGTPHAAIAVILAVVLIIALSGSLLVLANSTSLLILGVFLSANAALIVLKIKKPQPEGVFRTPMLIPILGVISTSALMFFINVEAYATVGIIILLIIASYAARARKLSRPHNPI